MKNIILSLFLTVVGLSSVSAAKLSEFLATRPVGKNLGKWQASSFVSEHLVGKLFALPSEQRKIWQLRFFTFEDREETLGKKNSFAQFVKNFHLEDLQSKVDSIPYNDGTFHSFTYNDANALLKEKGKPPLPEGVYFIISFREVML